MKIIFKKAENNNAMDCKQKTIGYLPTQQWKALKNLEGIEVGIYECLNSLVPTGNTDKPGKHSLKSQNTKQDKIRRLY